MYESDAFTASNTRLSGMMIFHLRLKKRLDLLAEMAIGQKR